MPRPTIEERKRNAEVIKNVAPNLIHELVKVGARPEPPAVTAEDIFRFYAQFCGDIDKTACATNRSAEDIADLAAAGNWPKRIAVLIRLQNSGVPGDAERGVNRATNFIQADRLRSVVERVIQVISKMSDEELFTHCLQTTVDKTGTTTAKILTRPFADLATAMEKCHAMTYQALSDTATDRKERHEDKDTQHTAGEMHLAMCDAIAKVREQQPR